MFKMFILTADIYMGKLYNKLNISNRSSHEQKSSVFGSTAQ